MLGAVTGGTNGGLRRHAGGALAERTQRRSNARMNSDALAAEELVLKSMLPNGHPLVLTVRAPSLRSGALPAAERVTVAS
jgi:hypothetical protein